MAKYIDKDALVAEITHKIKVLEAFTKNFDGISDKVEKAKNKIEALGDVLLSIDTLEVKEVDLKKEIENEIDEYWYDNDYGAIQRRGGTITMEVSDVKEIAKHFFELALSVNNPITAADRGMVEEIIINLKRVENDYRIDLTREMGWLRNLAQKGEEV